MTDESSSPTPPDVPIRFRIPSKMPSVYAHLLSVQPGEHEVVLSFFEIVPPPVPSDPEEQIKALQEAGVVAECVARVTIANANGRFMGFAEVVRQVAIQMASNQQPTEQEK